MRADVLLCDVVEMKTVRLLSATILVIALLAACASPAQPGGDVAASGEMAAANSLLLVEARNAERAVQPGSEEVFDFKVVNATDQPMPVVIALEHVGGQRWRTSLCVDKQCLLGDGSEPSVTDPVVLPPYLEQAFEAHLFVDAAARSGQQTALTLRVEPLVEAAMPRSVTLSAQVSQP
jgi:hypothetical protein